MTGRPPKKTRGGPAQDSEEGRFRPLPTGPHGLEREQVEGDQRERLRGALVSLIAEKGYPGVRIADLTRLAHVSTPTFYKLFGDKEELFLNAYAEVSRRTAEVVLGAYGGEGPGDRRMLRAMRAFADLAAAEPEAISLLVLGAFGAGPAALERRRASLEELERSIHHSRDGGEPAPGDLTVKAILGGIREVAASRLREGRQGELGELAGQLATWAGSYPRRLDPALIAPRGAGKPGAAPMPSERARRAEGRLPSGRSDLPRRFIVKSQRERIVDATAAIVAEKGLGALTIPEIARRANVSNETFYAIYSSKHDAFLGAQKVGMHQALQVTVKAYNHHRGNWPQAVAGGLRALLDYMASEPAHAHLALVDTFAASPEALEIRSSALQAFTAYLGPGYQLSDRQVPAVAAEAIAGGIWQILHDYIEGSCIDELPGAGPQVIYFALTPFLGAEAATRAALD